MLFVGVGGDKLILCVVHVHINISLICYIILSCEEKFNSFVYFVNVSVTVTRKIFFLQINVKII